MCLSISRLWTQCEYNACPKIDLTRAPLGPTGPRGPRCPAGPWEKGRHTSSNVNDQEQDVYRAPQWPRWPRINRKILHFPQCRAKNSTYFGRKTSLLSLDVGHLVEMYIGCYNKLYYVSNDHNAANKLWDFLSCLNLLIQGPEWPRVRFSPTERWELAGWVKRWWLRNTKPLKSRKFLTII